MQLYTFRDSLDSDYAFLFELKKSAEMDAIRAVFGWDESLQKQLHQDEWNQARPSIIELDGMRVGSFLLQEYSDYFYFGRFLLLPAYQRRGIGTSVLERCIGQAERAGKPVRLCYLQGNQVAGLYQRCGFHFVSEDGYFIYMQR